MFEDSLVESTGRIRTRSKLFAVGSFALQAAILAVLILFPIFYPATLPRQALSTLLVAPPPPSAPPSMPQPPPPHAAAPVQLSGLIAPTIIPRHIAEGDGATSAPPNVDNGIEHAGQGQVTGATLPGSTPPAPPVVTPSIRTGPVRVSAGVAAGHILVPVRPVYPAIAKEAHVQGTVSIEAVISKEGLVKQVHVISGPPLLVQAALEAINRARYAPFKLNGEPVEADTSINIVFTLGD